MKNLEVKFSLSELEFRCAVIRSCMAMPDRGCSAGECVRVQYAVRDPKLKLMYSTWFDIMNIVQLCIQVIAFFEVLVEHALIKRGKEAECQALNRVFAWFIMVVGYPATVLATIFFGMNFTWSALACVMLIMVAAMYAVFECRRFLTAGDRRRKNLAKLLSETDSRSPEFMEVFTEAFEAHDLDSEPKSRMQRPRLRPIPPLPSSIPRPLANVRTYAL